MDAIRENFFKGWVEEYLGSGEKVRMEKWTDSIAVGSRSFVEKVKKLLDFRAKGRDIIEGAEEFQVLEGKVVYNAFFNAEKSIIDLQNTYSWNIND